MMYIKNMSCTKISCQCFHMDRNIKLVITLLFAGILFMPVECSASQTQSLRGSRHCEVILSKSKLNFSVYNTIGLNDCPAIQWKKITVAQIKQKSKSFFVYLNGPRYWVIDGFENTQLTHPEKKLFGDLQMREEGVLHLSLLDIIRRSVSYCNHQVERKTTWIYKAGHPVYELINPAGQVYVMQSYSIEKSPLTASTLAGLSAILKLPKGWHFRTGVLTKDAYLTAVDNKAVVVMDDLLNTYQLAESEVSLALSSIL